MLIRFVFLTYHSQFLHISIMPSIPYRYNDSEKKILKIFKGELPYEYIYELDDLFIFIKLNFFGNDYKPKIEKYKNFVKTNGLNYSKCHSILLKFCKSYHKIRGKKLVKKFLQDLEKHNEYNLQEKLKIKPGMENAIIGKLINLLSDHTNNSKEQNLKFTYNFINPVLTWSTFRSYYYEGKFSE